MSMIRGEAWRVQGHAADTKSAGQVGNSAAACVLGVARRAAAAALSVFTLVSVQHNPCAKALADVCLSCGVSAHGAELLVVVERSGG